MKLLESRKGRTGNRKKYGGVGLKIEESRGMVGLKIGESMGGVGLKI